MQTWEEKNYVLGITNEDGVFDPIGRAINFPDISSSEMIETSELPDYQKEWEIGCSFEPPKTRREENNRLKEENRCLRSVSKANVCTIERNVQKVRGCVEVNERNLFIPEDCIKREIAEKIVECVLPFIEYDFQDNGYGGKIYTGTLYAATGDRRYEH